MKPQTPISGHRPPALASVYEQSRSDFWPTSEKVATFSQKTHEADHQNREKGKIGEHASVENRPWTSSLGALNVRSRQVVESWVQRIDNLHPVVMPTIKLAGFPASVSLTQAAMAKTIAWTSTSQLPSGQSCHLSTTPYAGIAALSWTIATTNMLACRFWNKETGPLSEHRHQDTNNLALSAHFFLSILVSLYLLDAPSYRTDCLPGTRLLQATITNDATLLGVYAMACSIYALYHHREYFPQDLVSTKPRSHGERLLEEGRMLDCPSGHQREESL